MTKSRLSLIEIIKYFCVFLLLIIIVLTITLNISEKNKYKDDIYYSADSFKIDRALVFAIIKVESGFDSSAVSNKGAVGLMQITPKTFDYVCKEILKKNFDINKPRDNIFVGCAYLSYLFEKFSTLREVLCAYNAGEGNVASWLNSEEYSQDSLVLTVIPFKETAAYVKKVKYYYKYYGRFYR